MAHLASFSIKHYRNLDGLHMGDMRKMNLIVGGNGVGKTSLLEAICLFHDRRKPGVLWDSDIHRFIRPSQNPLEDLTTGAVEMSGVEDKKKYKYKAYFEPLNTLDLSTQQESVEYGVREPITGRLRVTINDKELKSGDLLRTRSGMVSVPFYSSSPMSGIFTSDVVNKETIDRFSDIIKRGYKNSMIKKIRSIFPIDDVDIVVPEDGPPRILVTHDKKRMYIEQLGGGMTRLFNYNTILYSTESDLTCIDEIENGIHYSVLPEFWKGIRSISENLNVQIFATTHSYECIKAAVDAYGDSSDDIMIYALYCDEEGCIKVNKRTYDDLETSIEMNMEIR